jgi:hypothetical protein
MMSNLQEKISTWKQGPDGFLQWLQDIGPQIQVSKGGFQKFEIQPFQEEFIRNALALDEQGNFVNRIITCSMPRRHSKSTLMALLVLWRFTLRPTENIIILANSTSQVQGVSYKMLKSIILNTPFLRQQIGTDNVLHNSIRYPALQSVITPVSTSIASLYGQKITCCWTTEVHSNPDPDTINVMASSLGDSDNSWLLLDSTTDPEGGKLHSIEQMAKSDPTVYAYRLEYSGLKEALEKSPAWISRPWLKTMNKQLLPAEFASQHLNKRSEASNRLFPAQHLKNCKARYKNKISKDDFEKLIDGRKYVCGGGLDRAYMLSAHGDSTIWTTVARTSDPESSEPVYYVLNQQKILAGLGKAIEKEIIEDNAQYGLKNVSFESYNSQDIAVWATEQGIPNEVIHVTNTLKLSAFQDLVSLVRENRLFFPKDLTDLYKEMEGFNYEYNKNGNLVFGSRKKKDDRIFSLLWAVYSLRKEETVIYELSDIVCNSKSRHARHCFLRNGEMILNCANTCAAYKQVQSMYNSYMKATPESELTIQQFFQRLVKVKGIKTYNAL